MDYSVVIPVYNSQGSLEELHARLEETLKKLTNDYEIIFVDDFSADESWKVLTQIKNANDSTVKILRFAKNYGQHNALLCGFRYCSGDRIFTIDDDLQHAPEDMMLLVERMDSSDADLVYGIGGDKHSVGRRVGSAMYKKGAKYIDGKYGQGSSYRLIDSKLINKVIGHKQHFIHVEELLHWHTECIELVQVRHFKRKSGKSGYTPFRIFKQVVNTSLNYSDWPLKVMVWGGAFFSFLSFMMGLYFIIKKIAFGVKIHGFTALIVAVFMSASLILLCLGIIGKYLSNIYVILNDKPAYSVKEAKL